MRKPTIAIFFILGSILAIIGVGLFFGALFNGNNMATLGKFMPGSGTPISISIHGTTITTSNGDSITINPTLFFSGIAVFAVGSILYLVSWIGSLVATARRSSWVWFVCIFIFHWIAELIYLIAGPAVDAPSPFDRPMYPPQYPSQYQQPKG